jgi:hypothetical protein
MSLGRLRQNSDAAISLTGKVVLAGIPLVRFARYQTLTKGFRDEPQSGTEQNNGGIVASSWEGIPLRSVTARCSILYLTLASRT